MPADNRYELLHTATMVGLFTCVFVKSSERAYITSVDSSEVKCGMGGLYGNKVSSEKRTLRHLAECITYRAPYCYVSCSTTVRLVL